MPRFTIRGASGVSVHQSVDKDVITLGSSAGNDLVVRNPGVSPRHAEIRREGEEWLIARRSAAASGRAYAGAGLDLLHTARSEPSVSAQS